MTFPAARQLVIRPIAPADRDGLAAAYARMSDESLYRRFMSPKRGLTERELNYFTLIDHETHEALVAIEPSSGAIVGEARYAGTVEEAEVAFAVVDDWQGRGLGRELGRRIVIEAREAGIERLTAITLATNDAVHRLLLSLGFEPRGTSAGESEFAMSLAPALVAAA
jgi:RimJ/RimL family protein N-acetyltransferase